MSLDWARERRGESSAEQIAALPSAARLGTLARMSALLHGDTRGGDLLRAVLLYLATRTALLLFVWLTGQHYDCGRGGCVDRAFFPDNFLKNGLFQWDALQYRDIPRKGYHLGQEFDTTAPFFPGFPVAAWLLGRPLESTNWGGIMLNHLASIGAAYGVARLCRRLRVGAPGSAHAVPAEATLFWLASPLTLFFCVFLSESLFGFLSVAMLACVAAGSWLWALPVGIWLTATRNTGIVVVFAAALLAWERRHVLAVPRRGWLVLAAAPLGLLAFCLYEREMLGDALAWVHVQMRWNRYLAPPWSTLIDDWRGWPGVGARNPKAMYWFQETLALALVAPLFFLRKRLHLPWAFLFLGVVEWLIPLLSHSMMSSARYQAGNVYFALAIPALLVDRPMLRGVCWMLFGMVLAWYASTYPHGVWAT